ncbi:MAG: SAM-dependent chlorinase/fluorinase [Thiobacillus sp.]|uniref:SAM hydrolase/SAM-dependent halogenase family protein n=1 Tax=Thiobacillus sp. TaxID=924 RepID=UPI002895DDE4|nr:SAM-dependent chlorinase/fluorinase [Thiobacillus sp.]MDT3706765.1 SAM-dependent chlorinase/fluorinase [Thiobacillus sp.]
MIVLFTDFGMHDPYVGQVKARLAEYAPSQLVIDLLHEVPDFNPHAGAHLLAAFATVFQPGSVFLAVVDPGVGTARSAVVVMAGGRWFVGPDNGLLSIVAARHADTRLWRITWQPETMSATFHGRDVFARVAADIARGEFPAYSVDPIDKLEVEFDSGDLPRVIYIDHYGNAWTGLRGVARDAHVSAAGRRFKHSDSFGFVGKGEGFWFVNSVGLLELAVNRGSAAAVYGLKVGDPVQVQRLN